MVALPPPLGLGLGDAAGFGGPAGDVPGGSSSVCPLTVGGTASHTVPRTSKVFAAGGFCGRTGGGVAGAALRCPQKFWVS